MTARLADDFTRSLLTNQEVIAIDQSAAAREEIPGPPEDMSQFRVWTATLAGSHIGWLSVFNLQDFAVSRDIRWVGHFFRHTVEKLPNSRIPACPDF